MRRYGARLRIRDVIKGREPFLDWIEPIDIALPDASKSTRRAGRAKLVEYGQDWRWCSLWRHINGDRDSVLSRWPVETPTDWIDWVNGQRTAAKLDGLRKCVNRGAPSGSEGWRKRIANMLNLEFILHPRGRPRKESRQLHVVQRLPARQLDLAPFSPDRSPGLGRPSGPVAR
jgi:hypothetical protein